MPRFIKLNGWNQQLPNPHNTLSEGSTYYVNIDHIESVHEMFHVEDKKLGYKGGEHAQTIVHVNQPPVSYDSGKLLNNWYTTTEERASAFMVRVNAILNAEKAVCDVPKEEKKV